MAVICLGPERASLLSAHTARATPGHCSPQADLQAPWGTLLGPQSTGSAPPPRAAGKGV